MKIDRSLKTAMFGLLGSAMMALAAPVAAQEITVRYASPSPASDPTQEAIIWFTEEVTKRTDGRVAFELFLGNSLVKDQDIVTAIGDGLIEMGKIYTVSYPGQMPLWNMFNLPFTSSSPYVAVETINDVVSQYPAFDEELAKLNLKEVGIVATGGTGIVAQSPISTVDELKNFKVRARGVQATAFSAIGAEPVSIAWNDVYEALSKGVVDGSTNYLISISPVRHNEVSDYFIAAGLGQAIQMEIMNLDFWNALPDDIRKIMEDTMAEAEIRYAEKASALANDEKARLAGEGGPGKLEYVQFPAEERQKWIDTSPDFFAQWAEENKAAGDTTAIVDTFKASQDKFTAEGEKRGLVDMW
jgi:TRAP-type C4-dicarboxylate transport system substrate-binding protein